MYETPLTGLILTGGGARAAYQVGVLRALTRMRRECGADLTRNPFGVIVGTSAGAINAAALACGADDFEAAVERVTQVWRDFHAEQVYRADSLGVIRSGAQWLTMLSIGWVIARWRRARPRSLLDNEPLAELLKRMVPLPRLRLMLRAHHLHGLAVSASSYTLGAARHVLRRRVADRAVAALAAHRGAGAHQPLAPAGVVGDPVRVSRLVDRARRRERMVWRRLDAADRADLTGRAPRVAEAAGDRRRPHARATGAARGGQRVVSEPGADRGTCAVEHLPRCAGGRCRAHAPHQPHAVAAARSRRARRPRCGRSTCW